MRKDVIPRVMPGIRKIMEEFKQGREN